MSHWYRQDGSCCYQVPKVGNKGMRDTTLADARKLNLVPSVTTIIGQLGAPQLEYWKQKRLLDIVAEHGSLSSILEHGDNWQEKLIAFSNERNKKEFADIGTKIHDNIEKALKNQEFELQEFVEPVIKYLKENSYLDHYWEAEHSFASKDGYGGKVDFFMHQNVPGTGHIIDFKTKDFNENTLDKVNVYDSHGMQLAAYRKGLQLEDGGTAANLFISTTVPGLIKVIEWDSKKLDKYEKMFYNLTEYWQIKNNFEVQYE